MIPVVIIVFLVGAVLAWGFRVWILIPVTLLAGIISMIVELSLGAGLLAACGYGLLIGLAPQLGYAFGLFARTTLVTLRSPMAPRSSRDASVGTLFKQRSTNRSH
jgi:hypothetical protein